MFEKNVRHRFDLHVRQKGGGIDLIFMWVQNTGINLICVGIKKVDRFDLQGKKVNIDLICMWVKQTSEVLGLA